jgi:hypothetical protein
MTDSDKKIKGFLKKWSTNFDEPVQQQNEN